MISVVSTADGRAGGEAGVRAKTLGVSIGHVYVAKHRVARLVRKEIEAIEATGGKSDVRLMP